METPLFARALEWPWLLLGLAGACEVGFTTCMKLSDGFTRPGWVAGFLAFAIASFAGLAGAMRSIPLGTAYAAWTGLGAFGTALVGIAWFGDPVSSLRLLFLATLIASVIGLKAIA